ncbi:hypothetical protein DENSPDRAFT_876604 [Dentipellis sp. KUC8613]|nr:hypothetical protein DENSPDRAFT_876604 [Dentipellis sp. KUC8613]
MFTKTLDTFEASASSLLAMALTLDVAFTRLDERLEVIRDITAEEGSAVLTEKRDVLADIWTRFGANRKALSRLRTHATALKLVIVYHTTAHHYVSRAQKELTIMDAALDGLRTLAVESILDQQQAANNAMPSSLTTPSTHK